MASNYWDSTQARFWTFTKDELNDMRESLINANKALVTKYPMPEPRLLNIYLQQRKSDRKTYPILDLFYVQRSPSLDVV